MKKIRYITLSLFVMLSVSACGLRPNYQGAVEQSEIEDLYAYIDANEEGTPLASLGWREIFTDPALQALLEQALERNTDLSVAALSVEQAEVALSAARKAFLPSLAFAPQISTTTFGGSSSGSYSIPLTASWEVDLFGRVRNAKEQSLALLEQSEAYRQGVQTALIAAVAQNYYSLLMLDEQLKISEQTLENWQDNLRMLGSMLRAGRINETSVLQSEASSVALKGQIVTIKEQIAAAENSMSLLLAQPTAHIERGEISTVTFPEQISVGLPIDLVSNRPDVRAAEGYLMQAFYATAEARSSLYPTLILSGSAGYYNGSGAISDPGDILISLAGSVLQPIFYQGALKAQLKISKAQQEQALMLFKQAVLDAGAEVNNAMSELSSAQERLEYYTEQAELLESAVTKTELLFKHGSVTALDVLTTQLSLLSAQLSMASEKYNQSQGAINLYRALGGGEK